MSAKKRASKKKASKKKASKKKASKKKTSRASGRRKASPPEEAVSDEEPQWGEPVVLGSIAGKVVEVAPPQNDAALAELSSVAAMALILHQRLRGVEVALSNLQRDFAFDARLASIEGRLPLPPEE